MAEKNKKKHVKFFVKLHFLKTAAFNCALTTKRNPEKIPNRKEENRRSTRKLLADLCTLEMPVNCLHNIDALNFFFFYFAI